MDRTSRNMPKECFPPLLSEIPDPPKQLRIRGALPDYSRKFLCIVGARKYSQYGKDACEKLIAGLKGFPITIVSGLALGMDSIAHKAALENNLPTVALPGSGLDDKVLYPAMHRGLAENIIDAGGCLISEFPDDFRPTRWSFPQRNRIMAGMSDATLVIESEIKSGTLITSRLATEYNREVCTVPGSIFSKNSSGPHMLIRLGATPITSSADLLTVLGFETQNEAPVSKTKYADCSTEEKIVIEILSEPMSRDDIIRELERPASEINSLLTILEIKGLIRESNGEISLS